MGLISNSVQAGSPLRFTAGGANHAASKRLTGQYTLFTSAAYTGAVSIPGGQRLVAPDSIALVPALKDGGMAAFIFDNFGTVTTGNLSGSGALAATIADNLGTVTAGSNINSGSQIEAALSGVSTVTASTLRGPANISCNIFIGSQPSAEDIANTVLDANLVEVDITVRQALRLISAALAGKVSGAETTTVTIRNTADTKNRIVATVDASGNRSVVVTDVT